MKKRIYLDHAATTGLWPQVRVAMAPYLGKYYENASTSYEEGRFVRNKLEEARMRIAQIVGAKAKEIYFTSGGSESDNWIIKSAAGACKNRGKHIITSCIEHHAILHSCQYLEKLGYHVSYLPVDEKGLVSLDNLMESIQVDTTLVSIMYGNNEIGTIEPIAQMSAYCKRRGILFHTDAVQAVGQVPIDVKQLAVDALSASAHKFHGPKGVGFLYMKEDTSIPALIHGGSQEMGKRAGTENVAGIIGMAEALQLSVEKSIKSRERLESLRDYFIQRILRECSGVRLNGHEKKRLPGNVNLSFQGIHGPTLLVLLEEDGILAAAGSACSTGKTDVSHVIKAIGVPKDYEMGTLRFSLGEENNKNEIDYVVNCIKRNVELLRQL